MNSQNHNYKKFFIHTLGCKVNQYESQAMRELLLNAGFVECLSKDIADIYIVNTCTVTNRADKESRNMISLFHRRNPLAKIAVTGCYVENNSEELSGLPGVTNIVLNKQKGRIADILNSQDPGPEPLTSFGLGPASNGAGFGAGRRLPVQGEEMLSITDFKGRTKAFVKIQDGCDNFCSYCKVPFVRGHSRSKSLNAILTEVETLVAKGFQEIVLTGICLGAWGMDLFPEAVAKGSGLNGASLVDVLKAIDGIDGKFRVRLSSIEPKYVTDELIDFMARNKRMCRHLHIPLQSGDDEILKKMNRPYRTSEYKAMVDKVRERIRDAAITTDVLIGFPGESDSNFRNTVNFIKAILPSRTHIFTFSRRMGTAAYGMGPGAPNELLKRRYNELNSVILSASYLYRTKFLNKIVDVLAETRRDKESRLLAGYSDNYIKVLFHGDDGLARRIVPVKITDIGLTYTWGLYVGE
ncbi:MAG: tRNA (N(6)-L-threonylcarbamoyladenosine(37)-C(2))-methylthiotransferase MtaB [Candidatus Omnitrophota bacterium]|nr:tRNA (N(6)-L-threonylcarbamoyladenosine(37)-C(2))-methylthiotransferase MtaB [Candidatus Omnitrophota bacterium]